MADKLLFFEEEMEWRKEQNQRNFGKEILETMSSQEAKDLLTPLLEARIDTKEVFDKKYKQIVRLAKKYYAPGTFEFDFSVSVMWVLKFMNGDIANQDQLKSLEQYWLLNQSRKPKIKYSYRETRKDFNLLITQAKNVLIESLCKNPCKRSGENRLISLCPFHSEKTPSFTVFTNTNTFFCFGCNAQGDVITFYQKLYGVDFVEAVKSLTGHY